MVEDRQGVNIYTVAQEAGVSIATVSRVQRGIGQVAPETRQRVLNAIEALRYRPSSLGKGLARQRHSATGIVFPDLSGPYYSEVILGYEERAVAAEQSVLILGTHGRKRSGELVMDLAGRVDGMLIMGRTVSDDVVKALGADGVPIVLLARPPVGKIPAVRAENVESAIQLTMHLLEHGHRRIAFLGDPELSPDAAERWSGFVQAHERAGVPAPVRPVRSDFRQADGYAAAASLLDNEPRPTALMCANDEIALGVYEAARELGIKIPDQLAVAGWDDIPVAQFLSPTLTTVRQPMRELGEQAAHLLLRRVKEDSRPLKSVRLPTELVLRGSC